VSATRHSRSPESRIGSQILVHHGRQQDGPFYNQVNDQGRHKIEAERLFAIIEDDPVAGFFHEKQLSEATGLIGEFLRRKPATPLERER